MKFQYRAGNAFGAVVLGIVLISVLSVVWLFKANIWVVVLGLVVAIGVGAFAERWFSRRGKRDLLAHRETLSPEEIYAKFYASSGLSEDCVRQLWDEIAKALGYESSRIRPSDRFGIDLKEFQWVDGEVSDLDGIATERCKKKNLKIDLSKILTVDDYIRAFGAYWP